MYCSVGAMCWKELGSALIGDKRGRNDWGLLWVDYFMEGDVTGDVEWGVRKKIDYLVAGM